MTGKCAGTELERKPELSEPFFHPDLPFLAMFLGASLFFFRDVRGLAEAEHPCFLRGFPCVFPNRQGKQLGGCTTYGGRETHQRTRPGPSKRASSLGSLQTTATTTRPWKTFFHPTWHPLKRRSGGQEPKEQAEPPFRSRNWNRVSALRLYRNTRGNFPQKSHPNRNRNRSNRSV